jgi:hypothetical protein
MLDHDNKGKNISKGIMKRKETRWKKEYEQKKEYDSTFLR